MLRPRARAPQACLLGGDIAWQRGGRPALARGRLRVGSFGAAAMADP